MEHLIDVNRSTSLANYHVKTTVALPRIANCIVTVTELAKFTMFKNRSTQLDVILEIAWPEAVWCKKPPSFEGWGTRNRNSNKNVIPETRVSQV